MLLLSQLEMPSWLGRMPSKIGYTAGGSLTADEYKVLALAYLPITVSTSFFSIYFVLIDYIQDTIRLGRVAACCSDRIRSQTKKMAATR